MDYKEFLTSKALSTQDYGINASEIHPALFPFQAQIVRWAVKRGRAAIFADVGLGKTIMQLEWARQLNVTTLIIAPLAVAQQTVQEAINRLSMHVRYIRNQNDMSDDCKFYVTNYEMLDHFEAERFQAVVLDESSILKSLASKTRQQLIDMFKNTQYRLACTATPAPNDLLEISSHAEFLGVMQRKEMTSIFFTYNSNGGEAISDTWRLKKHSHDAFYNWLASWAVALKRPSDLGYSDEGYILPEVDYHLHTVGSGYTRKGMLEGFDSGSISAVDAKRIRRATIDSRMTITLDLVNNGQQWVIWTALNEEAEKLNQMIPDSVNVEGSMTPDEKVKGIMSFINGETRVLITKSSIAGMGVNMQNCHNMLFFGIDYSWEQFYQSVGRIHRFGQKSPVINVHVVTSEEEIPVYDTVIKKGKEAAKMTASLIKASSDFMNRNIREVKDMTKFEYAKETYQDNSFTLMLGDSCERMAEIEDESIDFSIYSPPFSDIFVYSATERDLGNSKSLDEFFAHYSYIIKENFRIQKPGTICAVHIQDIRMFKQYDGHAGRKDLSGMVIEAYSKEGWIFTQRFTIDKNPQTQAIRLNDMGLQFKTMRSNTRRLRGGYADYLLIFEKPGEASPVDAYERGEIDEQTWIRWAHPIWYDINETDVLNVSTSRASEDEKHVCPLQLGLIERSIKLWSNPGETVFSPFAGIGSEGYTAIKFKRRFVGIELKPEYYRTAIKNLLHATMIHRTLFDLPPES